MADRVSIDIADGVAEVRLCRADKRNALDGAMFEAIAAAGERLKDEAAVRAVVLSGAGASFCAGLDLSMFAGLADTTDGFGDPGRMTASGITHLGQQICWVWQELAVPVIAAVHGHALGGGLQLALGADVRIVHPDTAMSVREVHWGLVPDMTGTWMLARLTRPDVAKELTMTGRIFTGTEALTLGLATRLSDDPRRDALALAGDIAGRNPDAVRAAKALIDRAGNLDAPAQFAAERKAIARLVGSANQREAVIANVEGRRPDFTDPG